MTRDWFWVIYLAALALLLLLALWVAWSYYRMIIATNPADLRAMSHMWPLAIRVVSAF
jgi:hypothetical protein